MENYIIDLQHLSKSFGDKKVLRDINIKVRKGEFVTLLGPSGCGKTTILRLIAGFLVPDEGKILLDGKDIVELPPYQRPLNTVFQRYALFPHLDVYDNIAFGLKLKNVPQKDIDAKVRKVLRLVNMEDYEERDVDSLSGGQQQRVAIARALVNQPKVLLLDEPLAALDLKMRKDMQIELKEMHEKLGITFIYVTHDQEEALTLSDTIVVLNEGRIQQIGTPTDIYNEPVNSFVADFIGDSNILDGTMLCDRKVRFIDEEFKCVDEGFGENTPVEVVVRPEDVNIKKDVQKGQFFGTITSCTFKGVYYQLFLNTDKGYELMAHDYRKFEVGDFVGINILPENIQVMKKERICNCFDAVVLDSTHLEMLDGEFECLPTEIAPGTKVRAEVAFDKIDILDHQEEGSAAGQVYSIIYKGDHYHLTILTDKRKHIYVNTNYVWDKRDLVGIRIEPKDIKIVEINED